MCVCRVSLYDTVHKIPTIIGQLQGYAGPHEALIKQHFIDVFEGAKPHTKPQPQTANHTNHTILLQPRLRLRLRLRLGLGLRLRLRLVSLSVRLRRG